MRKYDSPYIADWFAISLRWVMLVGLVVSLGLGHKLEISSSWPLGLVILWNLLMTALTSLNRRINNHRRINLAVDIILAGLFFWLQGALRGPAFWAGLLPILTGSIYFELSGGLLGAVLFAGFVLYLGFLNPEDTPLALTITLILAVLGALFGLIGSGLMTQMRHRRQFWLDAEEKKRNIQTERLRAIYELTSTLAATLSYRRVLDSALDIGASALNPDSDQAVSDPLVGAVLLFKGGKLRIGSARRFTNADMRVTLDGSEGVLKKLFDEGEPIITKNIGYDPELGRVIALRNCTTAYCFPLRSGFNVYGALLFAHPDPNYFTRDRRDLLDLIGRQAVIAIQNARLYQDLVEEKERMVEVHEEARKKLARDLHDGPTQSVAAIAMRINIAKRMLTKDTKLASAELVKLEDMAHRTTKEIRHMLFTLRPLILESQGLAAALQSMADKMFETYSQRVIVSVDEDVVSQLEMGKQGVIFYIIEEAVNNARKHANAATINVRLHQMDTDTGVALLEVVDDGIGFNVESVMEGYDRRSNSSLGMVNLRDRTELVNGLLQVDSAPGQGTKVTVFIPLTEEASDHLHRTQVRKK